MIAEPPRRLNPSPLRGYAADMSPHTSPPGPRPRIVISYARADGEDTARAVAALLHEAAHAHAYDHQDLIGGGDWQRQFESWLRSADHLVLVLSPAALRSKHVRWEWTMARAHGLRVSPVRSDAAVDTALMTRWMRQAHQYSLGIPEQQARLLRELAERPNRRQVRFVDRAADPLYVERVVPLAAVKAALLDPNGDPLPAPPSRCMAQPATVRPRSLNGWHAIPPSGRRSVTASCTSSSAATSALVWRARNA